MTVREWLNNNANVATTVAAVVLVAALAVLYFQARPAGDLGGRPVYYLDLETGEFFTERLDAVPPVTAPSGGAGVRANLYTCDECEPGRWMGYLETYTEEARRRYEQEGVLSEAEEDYLVRELEGDRWVPYFSRRGESLREAVYEHCPGDPNDFPRQCRP